LLDGLGNLQTLLGLDKMARLYDPCPAPSHAQGRDSLQVSTCESVFLGILYTIIACMALECLFIYQAGESCLKIASRVWTWMIYIYISIYMFDTILLTPLYLIYIYIWV
jgi:hypothetical protein